MRMTIFHRENTLNYKEEYLKMMKVFSSKCIEFDKKEYTYFDYINKELFHNWKFRGTYLDCYEYLESIGVNVKSRKISKDGFLNLLEFICNIQSLMNHLKYYADHTKFSIKCKSILIHNIPLLLESFGYQAYDLEDRIVISEKELEYEDFESLLPNSIYECFILYKDKNNNGIKMKRMILEKIYHFLESNEKYKTLNSSIYNSIKTVVTKMGVIGELDKKYKHLTNYKMKKYYDSCFEMMVYLVKTESILKYKEEIKKES